MYTLILRAWQTAFVFLSLAFAVLPHSTLAFGITPATISIENILAESTIESAVFVTRGNPSTAEQAKVIVEGQAATYITLEDEDGVVSLPAGEQQTEIPFTIDVGSLAQGTYTATFTVNLLQDTPQEQTEGVSSTVLTGAQATVEFSVTNQVISSYDIHSALIPATEEKKPIDIMYSIQNTGNVDAAPDHAELLIYNNVTDTTPVISLTLTEDELPIVSAFESTSVTIPTTLTLKTGNYIADLHWYSDEDTIKQTDNLSFQVFPEGTLDQKAELREVVIEDASVYFSEQPRTITGTIVNAGTVPVVGYLIVNLQRDGEQVEAIQSETVTIPTRKDTAIPVTFTPKQSGTYTITTHFVYGPYRTQEVTQTLTVRNIWLSAVFIFSIIVCLGLCVRYARRMRKRTLPTDQPLP